MLQRNFIAGVAFALLAFAAIFPAKAQFLNPDTPLCNGAPCFTSGNPGAVTASISATVGGFQPNGSYGSLTATASTSASTALPTGTTVRMTNLGAGTVSCTFATGAATGLVNNTQIGPSSSVSRVVGAFDHVACIDQTGSSGSQLVILEGGSGLGNDTGGGGGGGGSSGAVFGPTAVGSAAANPPVLIAGTANAGATGNVQVAKISAGGLVSVDGSAVTQPVSGPTAVGSANANPPVVIGGTATGAAGQNVEGVAVKPASTAALATDLSLVTNESPNSQLSTAAGTTADSAYAGSGSASIVAALKGIYNVANAAATFASQYPATATPLTASATGTTAATTATLAGTTGKTTYICGYSIRANATANTNVTDTITGVISGTMSSALWVPANTAGLGVDEQIFTPCIPASTTNTAIAAVSGAPGTGGVVTVKAWGYQL